MSISCKPKIRRWLPGLLALALFATGGRVAYAQQLLALGGGLTLGQATIHVGNSYTTGSAQFTQVSVPSESATLVGTVTLIPACKVLPAPGTVCTTPDPGVITVTSATTIAGCSAVTWTVTNNNNGTFTLTPSGAVTFPASSSVCNIGFNYTVNSLPTADANGATTTVLDTGGSAAAAITDGVNSAGGVGTTDTPFAFTCGVKVDKQISCDGGVTWNDVGEQTANGDGNKGCIGNVGAADIKVRYFAQNISDSGIGLISCTIGETNTLLGPGVPVASAFTIGNNGVSGGASTTETSALATTASPLVCETTRAGGEPDTATANCTCNVPLEVKPTVSATDGSTFDCCGVKVDKQVSCNGGPFVDQGLVSANEGGTNGCTALVGQPVAIQYQVQNTGDLPLVCNSGGDPAQGLLDAYVAGGIVFPLTTVNIPGNTTGSFITNTAITTCSVALNTAESLGNKAQIDCTCQGSANLGADVTVSAFDIARIQCTNPEFNTSKNCVPTAPGASTFNSTVTVNNTGNVNLSCAIVDQTVAGACGTIPTCPISGGTPVSLTPSPLPVTAATTGTSTTASPFSLAATSCNQACITCTPEGGSALPSQAAQATCPVGTGCFTRTPGYWGTHPAQTQQVIGAGLPVCGITLTTSTAHVANSATEDLCESGQDTKAANTSPQQLQLIRQCTAAALNLRASATAQLGCEQADPGITASFNNCCVGPTSVCDSGASKGAINTSACIGILDAFNNQFDNASFPSFLTNSKADPSQCQEANGNGFVNGGRNLGSSK